MVSHQQVQWSSEAQIRPSIGVTAKFVHPLKLGSAIQAAARAARVAGFAPLSLTKRFAGDRTGCGQNRKATAMVAFAVAVSCWRFVSISRVAIGRVVFGKSLRGFPEWELPSSLHP